MEYSVTKCKRAYDIELNKIVPNQIGLREKMYKNVKNKRIVYKQKSHLKFDKLIIK